MLSVCQCGGAIISKKHKKVKNFSINYNKKNYRKWLVSRPHTDKKRNPTAPKIIDFPKRFFLSSSSASFYLRSFSNTKAIIHQYNVKTHITHNFCLFLFDVERQLAAAEREVFLLLQFPFIFLLSPLPNSHACEWFFFWSWKNAFWWGKKKWCGSFLFNATQTLVGLLYVFIPKKKIVCSNKRNSLPLNLYFAELLCVWEREREEKAKDSLKCG